MAVKPRHAASVASTLALVAVASCAFDVDVGGRALVAGASFAGEREGGLPALDASSSPSGEAGAPVASCRRDTDCAAPSLCTDGTCVACDSNSSCPAPLNLVALLRNGCATCAFAPPSQCASNDDCSADFRCAKGAVCAAGCADLGCCANNCVSGACQDPVPVGCAMPCAPELGCKSCVAAKCRCLDGAWDCVAGCTSAGYTPPCSL